MSDKINMVELYTDGSSLGNPGPSGLAYVIRYWELKEGEENPVEGTVEGSQGFTLSTNNRMEIMSLIYGINFILELLEVKMLKNINEINIYTDSTYVYNSIVKKWVNKWATNNWVTSTQTPVKNKDLWEAIMLSIANLNKNGIKMIIYHIPGHQGYVFNERADVLCTTASKYSQNHISDTTYEDSAYNKKY